MMQIMMKGSMSMCSKVHNRLRSMCLFRMFANRSPAICRNRNKNVQYIYRLATVVDKTHGPILKQITRGREGLGLNDQGFIVTAESNNITVVGLQRTLERAPRYILIVWSPPKCPWQITMLSYWPSISYSYSSITYRRVIYKTLVT